MILIDLFSPKCDCTITDYPRPNLNSPLPPCSLHNNPFQVDMSASRAQVKIHPKHMAINAGKRGLLAKMSPEDLERTLNPTLVNAAI